MLRLPFLPFSQGLEVSDRIFFKNPKFFLSNSDWKLDAGEKKIGKERKNAKTNKTRVHIIKR